jgi:hypothetical protein
MVRWFQDEACATVLANGLCQPDFVAIPAVSEWGLVVMTLLLLIGAKVQGGAGVSLVSGCFELIWRSHRREGSGILGAAPVGWSRSWRVERCVTTPHGSSR